MITYYPQIANWPFMGSLYYPVSISIIYVLLLVITLHIGRVEYRDRVVIFAKFYMALLALVNSGLLLFFLFMEVKMEYSLRCEPPSKFHQLNRTPPFFSFRTWFWWWIWLTGTDSAKHAKIVKDELRIASGLWLYLMTKILDFVDQFILTMQGRPVVTSDVIHHIVMVLITWIGLRYAPGGSTVTFVTLNCGFMAFAFTYQTLRRLLQIDPEDEFWNKIKNAAKWVKLGHFGLTAGHAASILTTPSASCEYPKSLAWVLLALALIMIYVYRSAFGFGGDGGGGGAGGGHSPAPPTPPQLVAGPPPRAAGGQIPPNMGGVGGGDASLRGGGAGPAPGGNGGGELLPNNVQVPLAPAPVEEGVLQNPRQESLQRQGRSVRRKLPRVRLFKPLGFKSASEDVRERCSSVTVRLKEDISKTKIREIRLLLERKGLFQTFN